MKHALIKAIFFAGFVWMPGAILTQGTLRAADTIAYAVTSGSGVIGTLDLNTGVFTPTASPGVPLSSVTGLGEYGGVLYGASLSVFQLNPSTGAIAAAPLTFNNGGNGFGALNGFGSTTNGLFAVGAGAGTNALYSVDPVSGNPTLIGSTGAIAGGGTGVLSSSNDSSQLYWEVQTNSIDTLYSLNTSTGAATLIGSQTIGGSLKNGNPSGMVFVGGTLWACFYTQGFGTINTSTGAQTLVSTNAAPTFAALAPYPLTPAGPPLVGSMGHLAAEGNWTTTFTLVNKGAAASQAQLSFFGDAANPGGNGPLALPLVFPQQSPPGSLTASFYAQSIAANASLIVTTAGTQDPLAQPLTGSAQLGAAGTVDGFAIFHQIAPAQEAVVPMETRNASSYLLPFDNTTGVGIGLALENVSAQAGNVGVIIRDDTGRQIGTDSLYMAANGHRSFILSTQFGVTANIRGTVEFDTPAGGQISVLGIRFTQPKNALTTIPALANVGTGGGSIAHIASGNGWQTTFVLVNTGTSAATVHLKFFADQTGTPLLLPVSFPQGVGVATIASFVDQTLAAGATLLVLSTDSSSSALTTGSAQLTTTGNVGGFVIFRNNPFAQEAVVPLETRNANAYILAFDNTSGKAAGIAINSVSSQTVNVPVVVRDDTGTQIATDTLTLPANAHMSFVLGNPPNKYAATANIRGTVEFDTPPGGQISVVGIRANGQAFTTLPALVK